VNVRSDVRIAALPTAVSYGYGAAAEEKCQTEATSSPAPKADR
jgi:hypothetical protein